VRLAAKIRLQFTFSNPGRSTARSLLIIRQQMVLCTPASDALVWPCRLGVRDFLGGDFHDKNAHWKQNHPHLSSPAAWPANGCPIMGRPNTRLGQRLGRLSAARCVEPMQETTCTKMGGSSLLERAGRGVGACSLWFSILVASFLTLQGLALWFSSDARIIVNLQTAFDRGVLPASDYPMSPYGDIAHRYDMFTECLALSTNLGNKDKPLLYRLAATPWLGRAREQPCETLRAALRAGHVVADRPYFRYWHGHQIYLRPLLSFMSVEQVHRLNALLIIGASIFLIGRLVVWFGVLAAPAFLIPFAIGSDLLTLPAVSVHAIFLMWLFISVAIFAYVIERKHLTEPAVITIVFCLGAITNYFDLLFNPPLAPTLFAFLALWQRTSRATDPRANRGAIAAASGVVAIWFAGYALAWAAKWMFSGAVLGLGVVVPNVVKSILFRIDGPVPDVSPDTIGILTPTYRALDQVGFALVLICLGVAALVLMGHFIAGRLAKTDLVRLATLQLPLILPVAWCEVLRNHTIIHAGFVSRSFVLFAVLPMLATLAVCRRPLPQQVP
jgi:hypothetical protein